jgi:type I restriction enzyme S subunit
MSKLSEMIARLCPNGVEYKKLGEIASDMYRGSGILRTQVTETGVPCVRYGEIYTSYGIWFDRCISHTKMEYVQSPKFIDKGDILFAITGESVEEIAKSTAYIGEERCLAGGDIVVMKHNQDPKYLSYALSTVDAQRQKSKGKVKSKVVHSSVPSIKDIEIPLPPLPVQREIVQILDNFANLTAELTAELAKRKKQYEHYRDMLLNFDGGGRYDNISQNELCPSIEWKRLGEIAEIQRGRVMSKDYLREHTGEFPVYSSQTANEGVFGYIDTYDFDGEYLTWTTDGANAGSVFYHKGKFSITNVCGLVKTNCDVLNVKYLYYWLGANAKKYVSSGMGNPKLMSNVMASIKIPLPPLAEQERIVAILDRFDSLCNSLTEGLPAEIALRKKQYEYYRDKLLSFKEAS